MSDKARIAELEAALREAKDTIKAWAALVILLPQNTAENRVKLRDERQLDLDRIDAVLNKGEKG